ncbi:LuxR C-terminal-related transcriptional regulator [Lamprobacter modestohalophilus]|uniref:helix-turn-helix transcriptional regulator n=1 Tax=Lamprobacter modestohalophilus TaxID=1064514 RepID=UPI002ADEEFB6|nr:LuxR C-terminal-related transcriptional regulator [Lamprobacter modestohalophilus]MEA1049402.1 LuxR C-terminal-related transcriptional regulator [Lamprobacter modestohalophilus]
MSRRAQPRLREVRAAYRLLGECLEQGSDANAWRSHLLTGVQNLTGARVALYMHVDAPLSAQELVTEAFASGFMDAQEQALWAHYQATEAHRDDPFHQAFYHRTDRRRLLTRSLYDVVERREWQRTRHYNEYVAACGLADRITSSLLLPSVEPRQEQTIVLHRDAADGPFSASATHLMRLLHHELGGLLERKLALPGSIEDSSALPPRLREVLNGLLAGEPEKLIAARLELSPHTVNRHVQRIYKHYGVSGRSRLIARLRRH